MAMIAGGKRQKFLSVGICLVLGLVLVLPFQNCGLEPTAATGTGNTYSNDEDDDTPDCLATAVDCGPNSAYLQISVDIKNPLQLSPGTSMLTVSGRCNTGNFPEHYISWQWTDSAGNVMASRNDSSICVRGRYQISVVLAGINDNEVQTIRAEIIGLLEGNSIRNYQAGGSAEADFSRMPPPPP
ncbi:MAG: hypothetical protein K2Q26_10010 [Bdellovibrionales bacterium]|nr:hypothetical protein [Bdellovibrionales bacterium]